MPETFQNTIKTILVQYLRLHANILHADTGMQVFLSSLNVRVICYCWNARVNKTTTCKASPNDLFKCKCMVLIIFIIM